MEEKHQSPCYWPFVMGIRQWPVDFPHKGPVMRKVFSCHGIIMSFNNGIAAHVWHICSIGRYLSLKGKCLHLDDNLISGRTESCQNENFRYSQWHKCCQNYVSVSVKAWLRNYIPHIMACDYLSMCHFTGSVSLIHILNVVLMYRDV